MNPTEFKGNWIEVTALRLVTVLVILQTFILFLYICAKQITDGTPVLLWDQFGYYMDAVKCYQNFSLDSIRNVERPLFSLPSIAILRSLSIHLNSVILIICNDLIYLAVFIGSVFWIVSLLNQSLLTPVLTLSIIWAVPQFYDLLIDLWGDVPTAAWVLLYTATLIFTVNRGFSVLGCLLLGLVAAIGLQVKPIFIFYLVIATGVIFFCTIINYWKKLLSLDFWLKIAACCGCFLVSFLTVNHFIFPRKLFQLIADLKYNNEVLGYWQTQEGIYNTWLWFINVLGKNFTLPVVILLAIAVGIALTRSISKFYRVILDREMSVLKIIHLDIYSHLVLVLLICIIYISLFVRSKEFRSVFFLFPLTILMGTIYIDKLLSNRRKLFAVLTVFLVSLHLIFMIAWSKPNSIFSFTRHLFFNLARKEFSTNFAVTTPIDTYEKLGIDKSIAFLESQRSGGKIATVFITHSSWRYNDAVFVAYYLSRHSFAPRSSFPDIGLRFRTSAFNFGGWGVDGGIPKIFFNSDYILTLPEHEYGAFKNRKIEVYNFSTKEALARQEPEFMDGLSKVYSQKNGVDETITIYRRDHLPSAANFVKIVSHYVKADPHNLFNVPFIYAALQIDPSLTELKSQLEVMAKPEFLASVHYRFRDGKIEAKVRDLLQSYPNKLFPEFTYPCVLQE